MKDIFEEIGVEPTKENKREIDGAIHDIVGVGYKNCSAAWKAVKERTRGDANLRKRFVKELRTALT